LPRNLHNEFAPQPRSLSSLVRMLARPPVVLSLGLLVLIAFLANPVSFTKSWNEGRSALLAVIPLALLEGGRSALTPLRDGRRAAIVYAVLALGACYYFLVATPFVTAGIETWGVREGVDPLLAQFSWLWGIDYAVSSVLLLTLVLLYAPPRPFTPLIYALGMTSFLFVDVILPYNSLGPFQAIVPPTLQVISYVVSALFPGSASANGNVLILTAPAGSMTLQVFWPSAGLDGMIIGVLVVAFVVIKLGVGRIRGLVYVAIGVVGSFVVNAIRIVLLAIYALGHITSPNEFEVFHSVAGDLVFIPWIILYVLLIVRRERGWSVSRTSGPVITPVPGQQ
jgi:thaumarchaeosortase